MRVPPSCMTIGTTIAVSTSGIYVSLFGLGGGGGGIG